MFSAIGGAIWFLLSWAATIIGTVIVTSIVLLMIAYAVGLVIKFAGAHD